MKTRLAVLCLVLVASQAFAVTPGKDLYLVSVGHAQGSCVNGVCSQWRTAMWIFNPSTTASAHVVMYFLERNKENATPVQQSITVAPLETKEYLDAVLTPLGVDGKYGGIRVTSDIDVVVTGRIYDENVPSTKGGTGTTGQFFVTAAYSNLTVKDVTGEVAWASSDPAIVEVKGGVAKGLAKGSASISAALSGKSVATPITITDAELVSLAVTPAVQSMPKGVSARLYATGSYTDGTTQDVTASAVWSSSNLDAVVVDGGTVTGADAPKRRPPQAWVPTRGTVAVVLSTGRQLGHRPHTRAGGRRLCRYS